MHIILSGGGTGGSVAPLLAIAEEIKKQKPETKFLFIGTKNGELEKEMIEDYNFEFKKIFSGKLRRYFSFKNFLDPFLIFLGFFQSLFILKKFKPDLIIGAGGYVSVPVIVAGWFLKIPSLIHQQDIIPSLTNKILAPFAKKITVSFEKSLKDFPQNKTIWTGNPVRKIIKNSDREKAIEKFNLEKDLPTLLVLGGGTGAQKINELVWHILSELTRFCQIIHLTGRKKLEIGNDREAGVPTSVGTGKLEINKRYHPFEFLTNEIADAYVAADLVISRAGMNVLSELAVLGKPTIIIPVPDSHQETNVKYFEEKNAAFILNQKTLTPEKFLNIIHELMNNQEQRKIFIENIKKIFPLNSVDKILEEIFKLC